MSFNVTNSNAKAAVKLLEKLTSALTISFPLPVVVKTISAISKLSVLPAISRKQTTLIPASGDIFSFSRTLRKKTSNSYSSVSRQLLLLRETLLLAWLLSRGTSLLTASPLASPLLPKGEANAKGEGRTGFSVVRFSVTCA